MNLQSNVPEMNNECHQLMFMNSVSVNEIVKIILDQY